jgi:hypothetical protein
MLRHLSIYYKGGYRQEFDILVPIGILGKCLDPGIQGTSPGNSMCMWRMNNPSPVCPESPKEQQ